MERKRRRSRWKEIRHDMAGAENCEIAAVDKWEINMSDKVHNELNGVTRRDFLRWLGIGSGTAALASSLPLNLLAATNPDENPLAGSINRNWEKIYRDQYKYDRAFDWV